MPDASEAGGVMPGDASADARPSHGDTGEDASLDADARPGHGDTGKDANVPDGFSGSLPPEDASVDHHAPTGPVVGFDERPTNATCLAPPRPTTSTAVTPVLAFPSLPRLTTPVALAQAPADPSHWYVIEKAGVIRTFENHPEVTSSSVVLDLTDKVENEYFEGGMLGIAFDPLFWENGYVYVTYTAVSDSVALEWRLSRFESLDGGATLDASSETNFIAIPKASGIHNAGHLTFGPDGYLYISTGDGNPRLLDANPAEDPYHLLGKVLRIDVTNVVTPLLYATPYDNLYADGGGAPEIYALGLRNPWRFSFDRGTGELWLGDVGHLGWEEVNRIELGGNYGWRILEGMDCFNAVSCDGSGLSDPIFAYSRDDGGAIIGGYVYRGTAMPDLVGTYVYGDYVRGAIWGLFFDPVTGEPAPEELIPPGSPRLSTFAEGDDGELYVARIGEGRIVRLAPSDANAANGADPFFPQSLTETGCVDLEDASHPAPGMIPYDVRSPLWSDGADKERWLAIPDGTTIGVEPDGDFVLPIGSVLVKTFSLNGVRIETRLLVRHDDGYWAGYAYEWNDEQTDAFLLPAGLTKDVGGQAWSIPSRAACLQCHTEAAGRTLGLEIGQLNREILYPTGVVANQLATFEHLELFDAPLPAPPDELEAYPDPEGLETLEARARSYLHANCSQCHRPLGARGDMDLRYQIPLAETGTCAVPPEFGYLGIDDALLVMPGDPTRSILSVRMQALDVHRMPPLATHIVDDVGSGVIRDWIDSLASCPGAP
jgi:uncharacterized repeat protein (TIGR03806 family)